MKNPKIIFNSVISAIGLLIVGGAVFVSMRSGGTTDATKETIVPSNSGAITTNSLTYKDGSYTVTGSYDTPAGTENLGVTLTLKNGIITDATVQNQGTASESKHYQNQFISGFKTQVIGKNISEVNVARVSGSSLTPNGFNDAVAQIKIKAQG